MASTTLDSMFIHSLHATFMSGTRSLLHYSSTFCHLSISLSLHTHDAFLIHFMSSYDLPALAPTIFFFGTNAAACFLYYVYPPMYHPRISGDKSMRAHHSGLLYANTPCMYQKPDAALLPFDRTKGDNLEDTGSELDPAGRISAQQLHGRQKGLDRRAWSPGRGQPFTRNLRYPLVRPSTHPDT
ncbi:hypothetical protein EDB86DRAFT_1376773 [Lactarius hatsudake]|nr:hypothetical protein EDB86DRAFT_1376773 [Lactarius hatsudake]